MSANDWNYPARFQKLHTELDKTNAVVKCQKELIKAIQSLFLESKEQVSELKSRVLELEMRSVESELSQNESTAHEMWNRIKGGNK